MLVTTQWPLKRAAHLTSLVWVCVLWLPWKLNGAICAMRFGFLVPIWWSILETKCLNDSRSVSSAWWSNPLMGFLVFIYIHIQLHKLFSWTWLKYNFYETRILVIHPPFSSVGYFCNTSAWWDWPMSFSCFPPVSHRSGVFHVPCNGYFHDGILSKLPVGSITNV